MAIIKFVYAVHEFMNIINKIHIIMNNIMNSTLYSDTSNLVKIKMVNKMQMIILVVLTVYLHITQGT